MAINGLKKNFTIIFVVVLVFALTFCLIKNQTCKSITVYINCESPEISSDLMYSLNKITADIEKKGVLVKLDSIQKSCGYLFTDGNRTKIINSALTDIELLQEIDNFFPQ